MIYNTLKQETTDKGQWIRDNGQDTRDKSQETRDKKYRTSFIAFCFLFLVLFFGGCASGKTQHGAKDIAPSTTVRIIKNVTIDVMPQSVDVAIEGDQLLVYTVTRQYDPPALFIDFENTKIGITAEKAQSVEGEYSPDISENELLSSVKAVQHPVRGSTRIEIALKKDATHDIISQGTMLNVSFSKSSSTASRNGQPLNGGGKNGDQSSVVNGQKINGNGQGAMSSATRLQSVYATRLEDSLKVFVGADGAITNYKSYTIDSPARIVFDIFNIESPYKEEKRVTVNTKWVNQIRYSGYPDRVRLVLDTEKEYLSAFSAYPVDNGLLIQVGVYQAPAHITPTLGGVRGGTARHLQSIYATQVDDGVIVTVRGDGSIANYQTSTISSPPTIVVDLFNIDAPRGKAESFPVDTRWVKQVRHERQSNGVRLYIETQPEYLSAFSAKPDKDGFVIHVGKTGSSYAAVPAPPPSSPIADRSSYVVDDGAPAWINKVDFLSENAGRSTLVLGTTRSVKYDIQKIGDRKLQLKLFNTKTPAFRQRPLITDRFDSAVSQIIPSGKDQNISVFDIDLREAVPYFIEQTKDVLMVHFEASSIAPQTQSMPAVASRSDISQPAASPSIPPKSGESGAIKDVVPTFEPSTSTTPVQVSPVSDRQKETSISGEDSSEEAFAVKPEKQYSGEKIALDFYETDIKNVFRILREVSGKNFAIDPGVTGKVTLTLEHPVPWDQVLDLILKMNKLGKLVEGDIIRIMDIQTIQNEEKRRQEELAAVHERKKVEKELEPLVTEYIPISYSNAQGEIKPHLDKIITPGRGMVSVDTRTNMIIMTDTAEKIKQAKEVVEKLDRVTPQVIIEARIVEANTNFAKELGVEWDAGIGIQGTSAEAGTGPQRGYDLLGGTYGYDMAVNFPDIASYATLGFNFTRLAGTPLVLNAKLMAMESREDGRIVSAPRILTLDNKSATISQGFEYPYQTTDDEGKTTTAFKQIDLNLNVTPHITPDNRIALKVNITKNDVYVQTEQGPALTTKSANTELLVNDGDTIVIGGIIRSTEGITNKGIPGLSKIPILGWLFKTKKNTEDRQELLIFITPRIVQLEQRPTHF